MYNLIKNVIERKQYNLENIVENINTVWLQGDITEDEKNELISFAQDGVNVKHGVDLFEKVVKLEERVKILENKSEIVEAELYPPYDPYKWYYNGDKCSENGKNYICYVDVGQVCTWSPSVRPQNWSMIV